jgi:hypothetical protein
MQIGENTFSIWFPLRIIPLRSRSKPLATIVFGSGSGLDTDTQKRKMKTILRSTEELNVLPVELEASHTVLKSFMEALEENLQFFYLKI